VHPGAFDGADVHKNMEEKASTAAQNASQFTAALLALMPNAPDGECAGR
jgi:hypothetical protein